MKREGGYCTSADGTRIAYSIFGQHGDAPLVQVLTWMHTVEHVLQVEHMRAGLERTAATSRYVMYDQRGTGASQREITDCSLATNMEDIAAVADAAGFGMFDLIADPGDGAVAAAAFASMHPDRVRRLSLASFQATGSDAWGAADVAGLLHLIDTSWPLAIRTLGELMWPDASAESRRDHMRMLRRDCSPQSASHHLRFGTSYDVRGLLADILCPTIFLVLPAGPRITDRTRYAASLIPGVVVVDLGGRTEEETYALAIQESKRFLRGVAPSREPSPGGPSSTAIILFADIADSTALTERIGDAAFREKARALDDALRIAVRDNGGSVVDAKTLGDGILATFPAASQAIVAALACGVAGDAQGLPLHIGVHAGDVIRESDNVFGGAVNIASRISALAPPGEVFVSRTVADLARTSAGVTFEDRGEHALKGIAEPQRVFAVRAAEVG